MKSVSTLVSCSYQSRWCPASAVGWVVLLFVADHSHAWSVEPTATESKTSTYAVAPLNPAKPSGKTFRLDDGTELPIEEWPETYETIEWQPPIDTDKAKTIAQYNEGGLKFKFFSLDLAHRKIYWVAMSGGDESGRLCRANLDGSMQQILAQGFSAPNGVCVVPELSKVYWSCEISRKSGSSIMQADLDGKNAKEIIGGLIGVAGSIQFDLPNKKIYWRDGNAYHTANWDGTGEEDFELPQGGSASFTLDFQNRHVYKVINNHLQRCDFDGQNIVPFFNARIASEAAGFAAMQIDRETGYLYWKDYDGVIYRTPLTSPKSIEQVTEFRNSLAYTGFAIDPKSQKVYWGIDNSCRLVCADLPKPPKKVTLPAPPLIRSFNPDSAATGETVTLRGTGMDTVKQVYWVGHPSGETVEANFRNLSNSELVTTTPKFAEGCQQATVFLIATGGATVIIPRDTVDAHTRKNFERSSKDQRFTYFLNAKSSLVQSEKRVLLLNVDSLGESGRRGLNVYFAKNGSIAVPDESSDIYVHEPHARISKGYSKSRGIPVGAIRSSFVDKLIVISN